KSETSTQSIHRVDMTGKEGYILAVRNEEEWNNGHLDQADNIPHRKLLNENIPFNKEDKIYVHCQSGVRSSIAVGILENKGFENVVDIRDVYQDLQESIK